MKNNIRVGLTVYSFDLNKIFHLDGKKHKEIQNTSEQCDSIGATVNASPEFVQLTDGDGDDVQTYYLESSGAMPLALKTLGANQTYFNREITKLQLLKNKAELEKKDGE